MENTQVTHGGLAQLLDPASAEKNAGISSGLGRGLEWLIGRGFKPFITRAALGAGAGLAFTPIENNTLGLGNHAGYLNYGLNALTGATAAGFGARGPALSAASHVIDPRIQALATTAGAYTLKQPVILLADQIEKYIGMQQGLANKSLEASGNIASAGRNVSGAAAGLGLLGGGALTAAGIYALYKLNQERQRDRALAAAAAKAKKYPGEVRVSLPTATEGDAETSIHLPASALPESTYRALLHDTRRRLRAEIKQRKGLRHLGKEVGDPQLDTGVSELNI